MRDKVIKTIKKHTLIENGSKILVGLSGGADSVALTHVLCSLKDELGIEVYTAHLNHGIRGEEALRDERFAVEFSNRMGAVCFVKRVNIKEMSNGVSEELLGREQRYSFFEELCHSHGIDAVATAHNKNDNAETLLMNFMRGSSIKGLSGIPYKRDNIIRPLLDVSREEIENYCKENGLSYVTDSTNLHEDYTRNKIRLSLIPMIKEEFNPSFISTVSENSELFKQDCDFIESAAMSEYKNAVSNNSVSVEKLNAMAPSISRRIIYKMICDECGGREDISSKYIRAVLSLAKSQKSGKSVDICGGVCAAVEYDRLIIRKKENIRADFEYIIPLEEEIYIKEADLYIKAVAASKKEGECFSIPENAVIKVRNRRSGDIFFPSGMQGRKKLKEYFSDEKIPVSMRDKVCIMTFDDEIGYIVGKRRDRRFSFKERGIKVEYRYGNGAPELNNRNRLE